MSGLDLWSILAIFCGLVLVATTFISHTVGAMVILPIVQSVGQALPGPAHDKLLVMGAALMCSGAMGLPVSGFPNMNAVALEDPTGVNYVDTTDFLKARVCVLVCFVFFVCVVVSCFSRGGHFLKASVSLLPPRASAPSPLAPRAQLTNAPSAAAPRAQVGVPGSVFCYFVIVTVGYALMRAVGY